MTTPALNYNAFLYFTCDRAPTAYEIEVENSGPYISGYPFHWVDTTNDNIYDYMGGVNGALEWNKRLKQGDVQQSDVIDLPGDLDDIRNSIPTLLSDLAETGTIKYYTSTEKTKLAGIATAATTNDTDANLKARANHTGTQTSSTISDFTPAVNALAQAKIDAVTNGASSAYDTLKELQDLIVADETTASALAITVAAKADKTTTVNGHALSGNVTVTKGDVGLGNADNTADTAKPVSTAQQTALDLKVDKVTGKGLSTNDFVNSYKNYLDRSWHTNSRSVATVDTATGFQLSSTLATDVKYDIDLSCTATIGGASSITVVLETANTNSSTPSDWTEVARVSNGQTVTLAIILQSIQTATLSLAVDDIPAGKFIRLRSIIAGTATGSIRKVNEKY